MSNPLADELKRLRDAATPGEWDLSRWRICAFPSGKIKVVADYAHNAFTRTDENQANAALATWCANHAYEIAAALNDLEKLRVDLENSREHVRQLIREQDLHDFGPRL